MQPMSDTSSKFQNSLVLPVQTKAAQAELRAQSKRAPGPAHPPFPLSQTPKESGTKVLCQEVFATNASVHIMLPVASTPQTDAPRTGMDGSEHLHSSFLLLSFYTSYTLGKTFNQTFT